MGKSGEMMIDVRDRECGVIDALEEKIRQLRADNEALANKLKYVTSQNILMYVTDKEQKAEIETLTRKNGILKAANEFMCDKLDGLQDPTFVQTAKNHIVDSEHSYVINESKKFAGYMLMVMVSFLIVFLSSVVYIRFFG